MPAALITGAYLATPSRIIAASSAGVLVSGSAPALSSASRVSGVPTMEAISYCSRSRMGCGVPTGAMSASHSDASKPG